MKETQMELVIPKGYNGDGKPTIYFNTKNFTPTSLINTNTWVSLSHWLLKSAWSSAVTQSTHQSQCRMHVLIYKGYKTKEKLAAAPPT